MQSSMVMFHLEWGGRLIFVILAAALSPLKCSAILARAKFEHGNMGHLWTPFLGALVYASILRRSGCAEVNL